MSNEYDTDMCWKCGKKLDFSSPVNRSALCSECGTDVRCCRNCHFYERGAHYDCREAIEEPVHDKERSCFCSWFSLNPDVAPVQGSYAGGTLSAQEKAAHATQAFNALFGD